MTKTMTKPPAAPASNEKTKAAAAMPAPVTFQGRVNVDLIDVREQVRKKFEENAHRELTESIRTKDVINPITLRPGKKQGRFELVAGERRLRAARAAGLRSVPAVVRELDDQAAALYQVEENVHRKDLTPIEEARGFRLLLEARKHDVKSLAELVNKSESYVYKAIRLCDLPKIAQDKIDAGEWPREAGYQLLRVPKEKMPEALKAAARADDVDDLRRSIENMVGRHLNNAAFPTATPYAEKPACAGCTFNSSNQGALFDNVEKGVCTNAPCFDAKQTHWSAISSKERAEKMGLKDLGPRRADYGNGLEGFQKARIVNVGDVQKLLKEQPAKFAIATVTQRYGDGKPETKVICTDPSVLPRSTSAYKASPQEQAARKRQLAKQHHDYSVQVATFKEIIEKLGSQLTRPMLLTIVHDNDKSYAPRAIWDAVGLKKKGSRPVETTELEKLSDKQLTAVAFCLCAGDFRDFHSKWKKEYADAGIDLRSTIARAEKSVAADEKAKKAAKA